MTRYPITPVAKPRMTRQDKWAQRPCVLRYRQFCDEVRLHGIDLGETVSVVFWLPMPPSWSKKRKQEMDGKPHQQKPDVDNMCKSLLDAVFHDDSHVWQIRAEKRWSYEGGIEL